MVAADADTRRARPRREQRAVGQDQVRDRAERVEAPLIGRRREGRDDVRDDP